MTFGVDQAIDLGRLLLDLGTRVFAAVARGDVKRVEQLVPHTLRTELAKARADAQLEDELAARRRMSEGLPGAGHS